MTRHGLIAGLEFVALAGVAAYALTEWLLAPVLDIISFEGWRLIGCEGAAALGGIGVLLTGDWLRTSAYEATGFVGGATWVEYTTLNDTRIGLMGSLDSAITNCGLDLLGPLGLAGVAGALLTRVILQRGQRLESDG